MSAPILTPCGHARYREVNAQEVGALELSVGSAEVEKRITGSHEIFKQGMAYASESKAERDERGPMKCGRPLALPL